jgi:hypothetical protein
MPKVFRSMKMDADGKPVLGRSSTKLGVRVPADIAPDPANAVHPGTGGMSVVPKLTDLPAELVPRRLHNLLPRARGSNSLRIWAHGEGSFVAALVAQGLVRAPDRPGHGTLQPDQSMPLDDYEKALAATRDNWIINETGS